MSKVFKDRRVLDDVSIAIEPGQVVGLIGPNGAGKSTLIRILASLISPTSGEVRLFGEAPGSGRRGGGVIGLLPEHPGFVEHLSGRRNLKLLASIRGRIGPSEADQAIRECGLDPSDRRPVSKYSLGMRQRLGLAQALMERPTALILDEPTNGLDVLGITQVRAIVRKQAASGVAVLLASHLLTELELACDTVLMIEAGRVLRSVGIEELRRVAGLIRISVSSESDWTRLATRFEARRADADGPPSGVIVTDRSVPQLVRDLVVLDVSVEDVGPASLTLEEVFLSTVGSER